MKSDIGIDNTSIILKLDDEIVNHAYLEETGMVTYTPSENLAEGNHIVTLEVADVSQNKTITSWHFTIDITKPKIVETCDWLDLSERGDVYLIFNEDIKPGPNFNKIVFRENHNPYYPLDYTPFIDPKASNKLSFNYGNKPILWYFYATYSLEIPLGALLDKSGNELDAFNYDFTISRLDFYIKSSNAFWYPEDKNLPPLNRDIVITFSDEISDEYISSEYFKLEKYDPDINQPLGELETTISKASNGDIHINHALPLEKGATYRLIVSGDIASKSGSKLNGDSLTKISGDYTMIFKATIDLKYLKVNVQSIMMCVNQTSDILVFGVYEDGYEHEITVYSDMKFDNEKIAVISIFGDVDALKEGSTTLNISYGGKSIKIPITVKPEIDEVIFPEYITSEKDVGTPLYVKLIYENGRTEDLTKQTEWLVDDSLGFVKDGRFMPSAAPWTEGTFDFKCFGYVKTIHVNVIPRIKEIRANSTSFTLPEGESLPLRLTAVLADGGYVEINDKVESTSSNQNVLETYYGVEEITMSTGTANVKYSLGSKSITVNVKVVPSIDEFYAYPQTVIVEKGKSINLNAFALYYEASKYVDVSRQLVFLFEDDEDNDGKNNYIQAKNGTITGLNEGITSVTACFGSERIQMIVCVIPVIKNLTASKSSVFLEEKSPEEIHFYAEFTDKKNYPDIEDVTELVSLKSSGSDSVGFMNGKLVPIGYPGDTAALTFTLGSKSVNVKVAIKPQIEALTLGSKKIVVEKGKSISLKVFAKYISDNIPMEDVTKITSWEVVESEKNIISLSPGSIKGINTGIAKVLVKLNSHEIYVTVEVISSISKIYFNDGLKGKSSLTLNINSGTSIQLNSKDINNLPYYPVYAVYKDSQGNTITEDVSDRCIWASNNNSIASVSENGEISGRKQGKAVITAVYGSKKLSINVTVLPVADYYIITPEKAALYVNGTVKINALVKYLYEDKLYDVSKMIVNCKSDADSAVFVSPSGIIKGKSLGTANVTVELSNGVVKTAVVKVVPKVRSIAYLVPEDAMVIGEYSFLSFWAEYTNDDEELITDFCNLSSSDPKVAVIDSNKKLTALKPGVTYLTFKYCDFSFKIKIVVV